MCVVLFLNGSCIFVLLILIFSFLHNVVPLREDTEDEDGSSLPGTSQERESKAQHSPFWLHHTMKFHRRRTHRPLILTMMSVSQSQLSPALLLLVQEDPVVGLLTWNLLVSCSYRLIIFWILKLCFHDHFICVPGISRYKEEMQKWCQIVCWCIVAFCVRVCEIVWVCAFLSFL